MIECTVGSLDTRGKLGKLIARSEHLEGQIPDREVITILATASEREALSKAEVEKAERDDVVVLAQEDLQDLWVAAQTGETSGQVVDRLKRRLSEVRLRRTRSDDATRLQDWRDQTSLSGAATTDSKLAGLVDSDWGGNRMAAWTRTLVSSQFAVGLAMGGASGGIRSQEGAE